MLLRCIRWNPYHLRLAAQMQAGVHQDRGLAAPMMHKVVASDNQGGRIRTGAWLLRRSRWFPEDPNVAAYMYCNGWIHQDLSVAAQMQAAGASGLKRGCSQTALVDVAAQMCQMVASGSKLGCSYASGAHEGRCCSDAMGWFVRT